MFMLGAGIAELLKRAVISRFVSMSGCLTYAIKKGIVVRVVLTVSFPALMNLQLRLI